MDDERHVFHRERLDEVHVLGEDRVRVADGEDGWDKLDLVLGGQLFHAGHVLEIAGIQLAEPRELRVREQHVRVARRVCALQQRGEFVHVFIHEEIGRFIEPKLPIFCAERGDGEDDEQGENAVHGSGVARQVGRRKV